MAFRTSRTFTVRGRPPRLAGGISEPTSAHSASVKSLSYLRPRRSAAARCSGFHMRHLSPTQVPHKETTDSTDSTSFRIGSKCLIPQCDGTYDHHAERDALWARFFTEAPQRLRRSVARYSYVKRA